MKITADLVKQLRDRTGAGMMECKKALVEVDGSIDAAVEHLRKAGLAKADKKAGRIAAEGVVAIATSSDQRLGVLVEVNCETDFVARGDAFSDFASQVSQAALECADGDLEALGGTALASGETVDQTRRTLVAQIGENISVRRFRQVRSDGLLGSYSHGGRIGVLVSVNGGDGQLARDLAMHIAASRPQYVGADDVPEAALSKEREILAAQAAQEGKPEHIVEKMVEGRLRKYLAEITLVGQPFVKDPDTTVAKLLSAGKASVGGFARLEVGEGIEKQDGDFEAEVMAMARGSD